MQTKRACALEKSSERSLRCQKKSQKSNRRIFLCRILGGFYEAGGYYFIRDRLVDVSSVHVPVVQLTTAHANAVDFIFKNFGGGFNATVTDSPGNLWIPVRMSAGPIVVSVVLCMWNAGLIGFAVYVLVKRGMQANVGTCVLLFNIISSLGTAGAP